MRIFQNFGLYRTYRNSISVRLVARHDFVARRESLLDDRYGGCHLVLPVCAGSEDAFFTSGDCEPLQRAWARENGMPAGCTLDDILLAQIEAHRTEVFYNLDPMLYGDAFLKRLPGCVRRTVAWRAAPSQGGAFLSHDVIVNNFPTLLEGYRAKGVRAEYLAPSHDPEMDAYAARSHRPIDVIFVGGYSRHHRNRAKVLEMVAKLRTEAKVVMHLDRSRLTNLAETPLGWIGPLARHRRSADIRFVARNPVFGRDLLDAIGHAKIVVNGAIDMAGPDRGNMRCWEAMGCGAVLLSDAGRYPAGMIASEHFEMYEAADEAVGQIRALLSDDTRLRHLAAAGHAMIAKSFSKARQWDRFVEIVS